MKKYLAWKKLKKIIRHGKGKIMNTKKTPIIDRLLNKIIIDENTDCWIWQGGKNNIGYGLIRDGDKMRTTHRVSYEQHKGNIPKYMCVCHTCDNTLCVNPQHLFLGTHMDNIHDMMKKGRSNTRMIGKFQPRGTCTTCGKTLPVNILARNHNNKCKHINTLTQPVLIP